MDWIATQPIAHRGLHDNNNAIPENSLAACAAAIERGYPIELDVRLLADGTAVVFHDADLERMTGQPGAIARCDRAQIDALRLLDTSEPIPSLNAILEFVGGRVPLLVEIKNEGSVGLLEAAVLAAIAPYSGPLAIQSFNPYTLAYFRKLAPEIPRGQLAGDFREVAALSGVQKFLLRNLCLSSISCPQFIAYDLRALPGLAPTLARRAFNLPLLAWTVRDANDLAAARQQADNIIFETLPTLPPSNSKFSRVRDRSMEMCQTC